LKEISGKAFARALERKGWVLPHVAGSHHIYGKDGSIVRLSFPIHANKALKLGLLRHLIKQADMLESEI
jgi:predicted RNA binding protein YcfA (HicA-like mRNA interferase family)